MRNLVPQRVFRRTAGSVFCLLLLILATPRKASAYVDPGSGAMLWQAAAAACIGSLFYLRRLVMWLRKNVDLHSGRSAGFLFAAAYSLVVSPLVLALCRNTQLPRFSDIFLLGVVVAACYFTWESATCLLAVGLLVSAWILPPDGSLAVDRAQDVYRLISFTLVSLFLICLITRVKRGRATAFAGQDSEAEMQRDAVGAD